MEKFNIQSSTKPKPSPSSKRVKTPAPNWQSSVDENSSKSIQSLAPPALDSKLLHQISDDLPDEKEVVSLSALSTQFLPLLPLRVKVVTGFCAENNKDPTLDVDDIYNIHLSKRTELVIIRDITGEHYSIPMYSSLQFGLIYDAKNETKVFNSVDEIINAKPLPKVIVPLEQYSGYKRKALFIANELLLIQSISKCGSGLKQSSLSVYSISSNTKKNIPGDCVARFTTAPWITKMYPSDMMEFVNDPLPCNARLYFDDSMSSLPEHLSREVVTIEERRTDSSFLMSLERHKSSKRTEVRDLIDIPTCIGIDVHILSPLQAKDRYQKLYEDTARLLKEFNPTKVQACIDAPSDDVYVTQSQLLAQCRQEYENTGFHIETSTIIGEYQPLMPASFDSAPQYEELDIIQTNARKEPPHPVISAPPPVFKKPPPTSPKTKILPQRLPSVESGQTFRKNKVAVHPPGPAPRAPQLAGTDKVPTLPPRHKPATAAVRSKSISQDSQTADLKTKLRSSTSNASPTTTVAPLSLETTVNQLSDRLHIVEKQLSLMAADIKELKALNGMDISDYSSLQSVSQLTRDQVLSLLDHLHLSQYKDAFRQEMVDGEILSEIDEVVLEQELGMTTKIHRLRLMKYIESHGQT